MNCAGVVLAGGQSSRMRLPKALLPFGPEVMLQRVVRRLATVVQPVIVVAQHEQPLPELPAGTLVAHDARASRGPLEGLLAGLVAAEPFVDRAFVTSCDVPRLMPSFAKQMIELLGDHEIAVPVEGEFFHPLSAVYHTAVVPEIRKLLEQDRLRPAFLFDVVRTIRVAVDELRAVDPSLASLQNVNQSADYLAALAAEGLEPDPATLAALGIPNNA